MMSKLAQLRLTRTVAQQRIRKIAEVSSNVILGTHAKERMADREIFRHDVDRALRNGFIEGNPERAEEGEWKCKMTVPIKGRRDLGVIVVLLQNGRLFVKTVEWEDPT
ncbi:MAG: DUF4258 domain-containing protein [Acidiferrobacteraceae bacterium]